jgi:hypothetical protein
LPVDEGWACLWYPAEPAAVKWTLLHSVYEWGKLAWRAARLLELP